ncbi:MAG TPA: GNAT family N-acetyltransferase [Pyrinomonadaceae bacterium]|nr:GNAT family N-acetyltransferase [Pyrinomonadaceae bacterium]
MRPAIVGDEPTLRELRLQALSEAPEAFGSTYERELARTTADWQRWLSPGITFILEQERVPRGLVAGAFDQEDPAVAYLLAMWVHPDLRGTGAADVLVTRLLNWAADRKARLVRLDVVASNQRARGLYGRHGFRVTGHQTIRERDGAVEVQMECPVNS